VPLTKQNQGGKEEVCSFAKRSLVPDGAESCAVLISGGNKILAPLSRDQVLLQFSELSHKTVL